MRCKKANILLSAYIDKELGKRETAALEAHIEKCSRCREKLAELEEYKRLANIIEKKTAPSELAEEVWQSLNQGTDSIPVKNVLSNSLSRTTFWAAAAVIAILIAVTLIPVDIFKPDIIETNYYTEAQKGGKGPPKENRGKGKVGKGERQNPDETFIRSMVEKHGGILNSVTYSGDSRKPCRIEFSIPAGSFREFRLEYNNAQKKNPIPDVNIKKSGRNIPIVISFPIRTFFAGDFNADGFEDIIVYNNLGEKSGYLVLAPNDSSGNFSSPISIDAEELGGVNFVEGKTTTGDFNADGFDDILIFESRDRVLELSVFRNVRSRKLRKAGSFELSSPDIKHQDKLLLLSGDFNGDEMDDLIFHQERQGESGQWWLSLNKGNYEFGSLLLIETGHTGWESTTSYLPFICDINGDGLCDTGMYGRGGERDACWYTSENVGNSSFCPEQKSTFGNSGIAYQGDYFPLFGDYNGDGLTDILVKFGSQEVFSNWYIMINLTDGKFTHGEDVNFNGKKDFNY